MFALIYIDKIDTSQYYNKKRMYDILKLNAMLIDELRDVADKLGVKNHQKLLKKDLIYRVLDQQAINDAKANVVDVDANEKTAPVPPAKKQAAAPLPLR